MENPGFSYRYMFYVGVSRLTDQESVTLVPPAHLSADFHGLTRPEPKGTAAILDTTRDACAKVSIVSKMSDSHARL